MARFTFATGRIFVVWTLLLFALGKNAVDAQEIKIPEAFSVEQIVSVQGLDEKIKIKFYFDKDKWRYDVTKGDGEVITIARKDTRLQYTLFPELKRYMTAQLLKDNSPTSSWREPGAQWKLQSKETIRGIECEKYHVTDKELQSFVWVSADKKIPLRVQTIDGMNTLDMENFQEGPQPETLFIVPQDYQLLQVQVGAPPDQEPPMPDPDAPAPDLAPPQ